MLGPSGDKESLPFLLPTANPTKQERSLPLLWPYLQHGQDKHNKGNKTRTWINALDGAAISHNLGPYTGTWQGEYVH